MRQEGAVPATIAVLDGRPMWAWTRSSWSGSPSDDGHAQAGPPRPGRRRWPRGRAGRRRCRRPRSWRPGPGIRVFATGGLGGVHREWTETQDESADLRLLARTRITVVCAGVKSILDVPATLQRLETLGVGVLGYGTGRFPGFYLTDSGSRWTGRCTTPRGGRGGDAGPGRARRPGVGADRRQSGARGGAAGSRAARPGARPTALARVRGERGSPGRRSRRSCWTIWCGTPTAPRWRPTWRRYAATCGWPGRIAAAWSQRR